MSDAPESSGSRIALETSAAALTLLRQLPADADVPAALEALDAVMRGGKELRPYQLEEVSDHVAAMADALGMLEGPRRNVAGQIVEP